MIIIVIQKLIKPVKLTKLCFSPPLHPSPPLTLLVGEWGLSHPKKKEKKEKNIEKILLVFSFSFSFSFFFFPFFLFSTLLKVFFFFGLPPTPSWLAPLLDWAVSLPFLVGRSPGVSPLPSWFGRSPLSFLVGRSPFHSWLGGPPGCPLSLLGLGGLPSPSWLGGLPSPSWLGGLPFPFLVGRSPLPSWLPPSPLVGLGGPLQSPPRSLAPPVRGPPPFCLGRLLSLGGGGGEGGALLPSPF